MVSALGYLNLGLAEKRGLNAILGGCKDLGVFGRCGGVSLNLPPGLGGFFPPRYKRSFR